MRVIGVALVLAACGDDGGGGSEDQEPVAEWACVHIAEGAILDGAATREEADTLTPGRSPYRVNLLPSVASYVRFEIEEAGTWTLIADELGAVPAVWAGEERTELAGGQPNPSCDEDLPDVQEVELGTGEHWLEVGPIPQGNVWLLLAR